MTAHGRRWRVVTGLMLPAAIGVAPAFRSLGDLPLCAFKHLTGAPCPLCGGIRTCAALAQGDFSAALAFNAGLIPLLAIAALHSGLLIVEALNGRALGPPPTLVLAWKLAGAFLLAWWLWRVLSLL